MKKLLRHLMNAPVAVALAFLLVGAPSAPMAKMLPSSGEAMAAAPPDDNPDPTPDCAINGEPDADCDGLPDAVDPCPMNSDLSCPDGGPIYGGSGGSGREGASWWEGYLDGDIGFGTSPDCEIKIVAGIKIAFCNDMDGDGDLEGSFCVSWEQLDLGPWIGVNCPDDPD